jgi:hypothetical protein
MSEHLKTWKDGKRQPCTVYEFTEQLRVFAKLANEEFSYRSDYRAHFGERLEAAADLIDDIWNRVGAVLSDNGELTGEK